MKKVIVGYRYVTYPSKNRPGEMTEGYQVYSIDRVGDNGGLPAGGYRWFHKKDTETKPLWFTVPQFNNLVEKCGGDCLYKCVNILYNQFGSIADIQVIEK